ncbi:hypothetical protein MNBD_GAMMA10-771 [hydrothermal vent metagenome]|uniref:Fibronectin type-III domain-containing protein n=1 Tax=hydrothermal vent metagenome TaxID=652676 RepID=A0A3B0XLL8_9ZZZZ
MIFRKLILSVLLLMLYACNGENNSSAGSGRASSVLPSGLQKLIVDGEGRLNAYITIDGVVNNRTEMNIDGSGRGSASASISGLSLAVHTVSITYEYTIGPSTYVLASANTTVDLSAGSVNINFTPMSYDFDIHDSDNDGFSNAYEVGEKTDPGDSLSVPGDRLRIVPKARSVVVNWNARSGGTVSYNLYYSSVKGFDPDNVSSFVDGAVISNVAAPVAIAGLVNGRAYYFVLEAVYATETVRSAETASRPGELVFDNLVDDIVLAPDGTRYVGGKFTGVGTATGGGVPVHFTTGKLIAGDFPQVNDRIFTAVSDGQGGWYIGGRFTQVGSELRQNLAHILSDLTVDTQWKPSANGDVKALAVKDNIVYAGGNFNNIGGISRNRLAAIGADGVPLDWGLDANQSVNTLAVSGSTVYVGGNFTTVGGSTFNGLAAINIDEATGIGALDTGWNPDAGGGGVNALSAVGDIVYAGGDFTTTGGVTRNRLAAIVARGDNRGSVTDWNPNVEDGSVNALAVSGNTLYVGGSFTTIGSVERNSLAAINTANASVRPRWNPSTDNEVNTLAVIGNVVYVGGEFTRIGGEARNHLAALGTDGRVTRWNPRPNNNINALAVSGDALYVGGVLTTIGSASIERNRLAAIGPDGNFTRWNPNIGGTGPNGKAPNIISLVYSDNTIYAGGNFTEVNGAAFKNLVAIGTDGRVNTNWALNPDKTVRTLTVDSNGVLYTGGDFTQIGGANRSLLAAINPDGTLTGWNPAANGPVHTLAVSSGIVYIGGRFTEINGTARGKLAAVRAGGGLDNVLLGWDPNLGVEDSAVARSLAVSGNSVYVGGAFTNVAGISGFSNLAAIDISDGVVNAGWTPQVDKDVIMLTVANNTVYVGGSFNTINGSSRKRLGAIAIDSASVTDWNPVVPSGNVLALLVEGSTVYAGGSFRLPRKFLWSGYAVLDANTGDLK